MKVYVGILGAALLLSGCGILEKLSGMQGGSEEDSTEEGSIDPTKNPLGALGALKGVAEDMQNKVVELKEKQARTPIDPVGYQELMGLLPSPDDWEYTTEPKGETTQAGPKAEFKVSEAQAQYKKDLDKKTRARMSVTIVDGSYVPMIYAPFTLMTQFKQEGSDGHSKGIKFKGHPGFEKWKKKSGSIEVSVLVADRFVVTIKGRNVEEKTGREWLELIDLAKLEKWAKEGEEKAAKEAAEGKDAQPATAESE